MAVRITGEPENKIFPMKMRCRRVVDSYGLAYGAEVDFCGRELEFDEEDVRAHDWFKYPDYEGTDYGVVCPGCGKFVVIDPKLLPERVKKNAEKIRIS